MTISAAMVRDLRDKTGAGIMECKAALAEASGDLEKAIDVLRKRGLKTAEKKAGRIATDGLVAAWISSARDAGALVEVNCETDFVARTEQFSGLTRSVVTLVGESGAATPDVDGLLTRSLNGKQVAEVVKETIGSKGDPPPVMKSAPGYGINDHLFDLSSVTQIFQSHNPVVKIAPFPVGVHGIEIRLFRKLWVRRKPHQTALPFVGNIDIGIRGFSEFPIFDQSDSPWPLTHEGPAIMEKHQRPRDLKVLDPDLHLDPVSFGEESISNILRCFAHQRGTGGYAPKQKQEADRKNDLYWHFAHTPILPLIHRSPPTQPK